MPWTRAAVESELIAAFRAMPSCPVYGGRGTRLRPADMNQADRRGPRNANIQLAMTDVLNWKSLLDGDPDACKYLLTWARCKATENSFAEYCRGMGWKQMTAERGRRRGAETIATALNATVRNAAFRAASNAQAHRPRIDTAYIGDLQNSAPSYTKKSLDFDKGGIGAFPDIVVPPGGRPDA